jgi:hypothetical protein
MLPNSVFRNFEGISVTAFTASTCACTICAFLPAASQGKHCSNMIRHKQFTLMCFIHRKGLADERRAMKGDRVHLHQLKTFENRY